MSTTPPSFKDQVRSASPPQHNHHPTNGPQRLPDFKDQVRSAPPPDHPPAAASAKNESGEGGSAKKKATRRKGGGGPDFKDQARSAAGTERSPSTAADRRDAGELNNSLPPPEEETTPVLVSAFAVNSVAVPSAAEPRSTIFEAVPVNVIRRRLCLGLLVLVLVLVAGVTAAVVLTQSNNDNRSTTSDPVTVSDGDDSSVDNKNSEPTSSPVAMTNITATPTAISASSSSPPTAGSIAFVQLGQELEGSGNNDQFGSAVALSSNGTVLAVGSLGEEGRVRVFDLVVGGGGSGAATAWEERPSVSGLAGGDNFGRSVDLSGDGSVLVAGAPLRDDNDDGGGGTDAGSVRVFAYQAGAWVPIGLEILGTQAEAQSGHSVGISETGDTIAIGTPFWVSSNDNSGMVRVYRNDNNVWTQVGQDIVDEPYAYGDTGWSVSLSSSGKMMAVGSHRHEIPFDETGLVRVYELVDNTWQQLGQDLSGKAARHDVFGDSVSLSSDGATVAGGASAGYIAVYRMFGSNWEQLGDYLDGSIASLSGDGNLLAVSSETAGIVQVYIYRSASNEWEQVGGDIVQEVSGGRFGASFDLTRQDGKATIAVGAPFEFNGGLLSDFEGSVRVYELDESEA